VGEEGAPSCGAGEGADTMGAMKWELIGHGWAAELLSQHIQRGSVRHAYLITGPDGIGKRTLALRFAQALCCEEPPEAGDRCGSCAACRRIESGSYPDFHLVEVGQLDDELGRTSSEILVEQILRLQRQLALTPHSGKWRVGLIRRFWEASETAANALLKTLEEPAASVVLLLTARTAEALLPTIVSRCEIINLRPVSRSKIRTALEGRGMEPDESALIASLAAGRPGFALRLAEDPTWLARRQERIQDLLGLLPAARAERFAYAEQIGPKGKGSLKKVRDELAEMLELWLGVWRDIFLLSAGLDQQVQNTDLIGPLRHLASALGRERAVRALASVETCLQNIMAYANIRLALETLMLELPQLDIVAER